MTLAPQDITLISLLQEFTYLNSNHLSALTKRQPQIIRRRLRFLRTQGLVKRLPLPFTLGEPVVPEAYVHFLTDKGADFCLARGFESHAPQRTTNTWLKHDLDITELHLALKEKLPTHGRELSFWQQFNIADQGVNPDAFFGIRNPQDDTTQWFYLENERGRAKTINKKQTVIEKMERYRDYGDGRFQKTWNLGNFRVLFVFPTIERVKNVLGKMQAANLTQRKFWLTTLEGAQDVGSNAWMTAKDDQHFSLVA